jgi:hypothetical protein
MEIKINGEVVSEQGFRALFPNTSMPQPLTEAIINDLGGVVVFEGPQATGGTVYQYSMRQGFEELNGKTYTKYILGPVFIDSVVDGVTITAAEAEAAYKVVKDTEQAKSVRDSRTQKLKDSDWTQVIDAPVDQTLWAYYRQSLRDVTSQESFPWTIEWPVEPTI